MNRVEEWEEEQDGFMKVMRCLDQVKVNGKKYREEEGFASCIYGSGESVWKYIEKGCAKC